MNAIHTAAHPTMQIKTAIKIAVFLFMKIIPPSSPHVDQLLSLQAIPLLSQPMGYTSVGSS